MSQVSSPEPAISHTRLTAVIRSEGGGRNFPRFYIVHMLGSVFPLTAGAILYGWRAMAVLMVALASTLGFTVLWQRIGRRGGSLHIPHAIWLAILLTMMLPPHLLVGREVKDLHAGGTTWMIIPAACLLMVMLLWLTGGVGFSRVHPLLITQLVLVLFFYVYLHPHLVLHRSHMLTGDLANVIENNVVTQSIRAAPWIASRDEAPTDAIYIPQVASQQLIEYTRLKHASTYGWISVEGLVRDAMPPLEDLVVGGHPGPQRGARAAGRARASADRGGGPAALFQPALSAADAILAPEKGEWTPRASSVKRTGPPRSSPAASSRAW